MKVYRVSFSARAIADLSSSYLIEYNRIGPPEQPPLLKAMNCRGIAVASRTAGSESRKSSDSGWVLDEMAR